MLLPGYYCAWQLRSETLALDYHAWYDHFCAWCRWLLRSSHLITVTSHFRRLYDFRMNGIIRNTLRIASLRGALSSSATTSIGGSQSTRALWNTCTRRQKAKMIPSSYKLYDVNARCYCNSYKGISVLFEVIVEKRHAVWSPENANSEIRRIAWLHAWILLKYIFIDTAYANGAKL